MLAVSEATGPKENSRLLKNLYSTLDQVHQVFYEKTGSHQNQHVTQKNQKSTGKLN